MWWTFPACPGAESPRGWQGTAQKSWRKTIDNQRGLWCQIHWYSKFDVELRTKSKIWELKDVDADYVTAWSKGGLTDIIIAKCHANHTIKQRAISDIVSKPPIPVPTCTQIY